MSICTESTRGLREPVLQVLVAARVFLGQRVNLQEKYDYPNFVAGFAYVTCGLGLWQRRRWAVPLAVFIAAATGLVFAAFGVHAWIGGAYETRTVGAMTLRTLLWAGIAATARRVLRQLI